MTEINDNIRIMRERHNLTQAEMAERVHMSASGYAKIEQGATKLFHEKLEKIAEVFGVSIYQLIPQKSSISLVANNNNHNTLYYGEDSSRVAMLEQDLKHQQEILEHKNNEINALKDDISSLKKIIALLEKDS